VSKKTVNVQVLQENEVKTCTTCTKMTQQNSHLAKVKTEKWVKWDCNIKKNYTLVKRLICY